MSVSFIPLVKGKTTAVSPNVGSLLDDVEAGTYYVPEYQRDSEQWDLPKRSLFIESLLNNLTIPPLIVYPEDDDNGVERHQIIDGQQRLTTIRDYVRGGFALATEDEVGYAENVGPLIQGRKFGELPDDMRAQIRPVCHQSQPGLLVTRVNGFSFSVGNLAASRLARSTQKSLVRTPELLCLNNVGDGRPKAQLQLASLQLPLIRQ